MKFTRSARSHRHEFSLPMINIVFLLLVFFMLAGVIEATEIIEINPPEAQTGGQSENGKGDVLVAANGDFYIGDRQVTASLLSAEIAGLRDRDPDLIIRLKADSNAAATLVIVALNALRDAGLGKVELLTIEARQ